LKKENIKQKLKNAGLRITPQRIIVLEALINNRSHPTADKLIEIVQNEHPHIAVGTIYNILETFAKLKIISKVNTKNNIARYDAITEQHHHLYSIDNNKIEDYYDDKLTQLLEDYLKNSNIPDFKISDFKIQLIGEFTAKKTKRSNHEH